MYNFRRNIKVEINKSVINCINLKTDYRYLIDIFDKMYII